MKIGLTMNPNASPSILKGVVQLAENLGYSLVYVADQGFSRDVYVTLTMLAEVTQKIQLGPGITHPYTRHPLVAAAAVATIDELSDGRGFLGIGAGGSRTLSPLNIARSHPLSATREAVEIARRLWRDRNVHYEGQHFQVMEAGLDFSTRSDIPIHWAARGQKMLALGGEIADVVFLNGIPHFELKNSIAQVWAGAARSERSVRINYSAPFVYDEESRRVARAKIVYRIVDSPASVRHRLGISSDLVDEIRQLVTTQGPDAAAHLLDKEILDHYVLDGQPNDVAEKVRSLFTKYDLDTLIVEVSDPSRAEELLPYAAEVIARARRQGTPSSSLNVGLDSVT